MSNTRVIEVHHLTKRFGDFTAVSDISFSVSRGEIVGLLGPNGAGKTTTIQMLLGLITPTGGTIEIFGQSLQTHREDILAKVNFSSTYTHLPWRLSVEENLTIIGYLYGIADVKRSVDESIRQMGLDAMRKKQTGELSAGWVTRVNLARTFLNDPQLILLDEPTASLDPESAHEVREKILQMKKRNNGTIVWTSHNMAEVEEVCDRVIFLQKGTIIAEDTPLGLARGVKDCVVSFLFDEKRRDVKSATAAHPWKWKQSQRLFSVTLPEKEIAQLLQLLSNRGIRYTDISIEKPSLEDFFLKMGKREKSSNDKVQSSIQ